jgi:hypothetical protein
MLRAFLFPFTHQAPLDPTFSRSVRLASGRSGAHEPHSLFTGTGQSIDLSITVSYICVKGIVFDFLKNLAVNLQATGPPAVLCVWIIAVAAIAIWGQESISALAIGVLLAAGVVILGGLAQRIK